MMLALMITRIIIQMIIKVRHINDYVHASVHRTTPVYSTQKIVMLSAINRPESWQIYIIKLNPVLYFVHDCCKVNVYSYVH